MEERRVSRRETKPLPKLIVHYAPDSQMLSIHNGQWTADGETITKELTVFYDSEGHPAGFVLDTAEFQLKPFLDAVLAKEYEDRPAPPVELQDLPVKRQ